MAYAWTKELETGNSLIDQEHKQLFNAINGLLDACSKGQGRNEIQATLDFLNQYTIKHFSDEEKIQLGSKYPDYTNHKKYHEGFKKVVSDIAKDFNKDGATIVLVSKVNHSIADWLINHIKKEDVKVAAHVKKMKL